MHRLRRFWEHFEEAFIAFLLAAMTLVTFVYVVLNNLYPLFYSIGDAWEGAARCSWGSATSSWSWPRRWSGAWR